MTFDGFKWVVRIPRHLSLAERQEDIKERLIQWYRLQAKEILGGRVFHFARIMKLGPQEIHVKTQKRLWGCCNYHKQTISLNWQIVMAPLAVVDYVVVHELCHLKIPNHSKQFWQKVEEVLADYQRHRSWLKINAEEMVLP